MQTTISHQATDKRNRPTRPSNTKRFVFALLFGVIATGMTFYIVTFAAMFGALGSGKLNPAMSPGVNWSLRDLGVPAALVVGIAVFAITLWRSRPSLDSKPGFQIKNQKSEIKN